MIHFIGIKGTGMAALACILKDLNYEVQGSDLSNHFFTEEPLINRNIPIMNFDKNNIQDGMTVIIGNAFHDDFPEVEAALANPRVKASRYHQYLGELMKNYHSIAVSGSHGKTTTATMLSNMLAASGPCGYLIGDGSGAMPKAAKHFVVEACEFRRHFLQYYPDYAIITNAELDHVDYFKDAADYHLAYEQFADNVRFKVALFGDDPETKALKIEAGKAVYYGCNRENDIQAVNLQQFHDHCEFDVLAFKQFFGHFSLPIVGEHLLADALACITIGYLQNIGAEKIQEGLAQFRGAKRRYVVADYGDNVFIDDYAHHSTEVAMTIKATKMRYPAKRIVAIFKPHRASRLLRFLPQYIEALKQADYSGVCEFTSIDDFDDGTEASVAVLTKEVPGCRLFREEPEDVAYLASLAPAVFLFMSSKDIYDFAAAVKKALMLK